MMKGHIQIKTGEFEQIKLEVEVKDYADAVDQFRGLREAWRGPANGPGLLAKDWNTVVDSCLAGTLKFSAEQWEAMSPQQQWFLNEIKKSKNRKPVTNLTS